MKPHYPILDGLRGTAAILVVIFHLFEAYYPVMANHPMHHAFLAVDFFYLLSGFVVGYAYDDRWSKMTIGEFFKIRVIRLHALVILGTLIGAIGFWFDPYTATAQHVNLFQLIGEMLIGFTMLPAPDIRGWGETHSLDGPCWSLLQEYIANILYAVIGAEDEQGCFVCIGTCLRNHSYLGGCLEGRCGNRLVLPGFLDRHCAHDVSFFCRPAAIPHRQADPHPHGLPRLLAPPGPSFCAANFQTQRIL